MARAGAMRGIYPGWYVVALAGFTFMLVVGATIGSFGLFVLPVSKDLGLSRASMNTAYVLSQLGMAVWAPFVGRALDRLPARRVMIFCSILFGLSMIGLALSRSIWLSATILFIFLPIAELGTGALALVAILVRWFSANRGKALLLFNLGGPFCSVTVVPVMAALIASHSWRSALMIAGVAVALVCLTTALLIRTRPAPGRAEWERGATRPVVGASPADAPPAAAGGTARIGDILRLPQFWIIALTCCLPLGITSAVGVSIYPFAIQQGYSTAQATLVMSCTGLAACIGVVLAAFVIDRFNRRLLLAGIFSVGAIALALMASGGGYPVILTATMLFGIFSGVVTPTFLTYLADVFGPGSFATVQGMMTPILAIVAALLINFAGQVFDRTGAYEIMFHIFLGAQIASAVMLVALMSLKAVSRRLPTGSGDLLSSA